MKKIIAIAVLICAMSSCAAVRVMEHPFRYNYVKDVVYYVDPATGVYYLITIKNGCTTGITPRLNADGSLFVTKEAD